MNEIVLYLKGGFVDFEVKLTKGVARECRFEQNSLRDWVFG